MTSAKTTSPEANRGGHLGSTQVVAGAESERLARASRGAQRRRQTRREFAAAIGCQQARSCEALGKCFAIQQEVAARLEGSQEGEVGLGEAERSAHRHGLMAGGFEGLADGRAAGTEQDAALFLTAAFTGLRMGQLRALRWRDVDFAGNVVRVRASYYLGQLTTPKSGKVRAVPLAPPVAAVLADLGQRPDWVEADDLVFAGFAGSYLDGSALRRRYKVALAAGGLRPLRFHDLVTRSGPG